MKTRIKKESLRRAKLFFNKGAGRPVESPQQLMEILAALQAVDILPEVTLGHSRALAKKVIKQAEADGTDLVIVAGGDGTISKVAAAAAGTSRTIGIIPTGTHNNMALNLGIPNNIPDAVEFLKSGNPLNIDLAEASIGRKKRMFIETLTLGLWSDMLSVTGHQQHGDLSKLGELLSTFVAATPFKFRMILDREETSEDEAHMVVIANVPYIGPNLQIHPDVAFNDGQLDVFVFSEMSKLGLVSYALRSMSGTPENGHVPSYRAKHIVIEMAEENKVMADGLGFGDAKRIEIKIVPKSLNVIAGTRRGVGPRPSEIAELKQKK